jgi:hypothetical protein
VLSDVPGLSYVGKLHATNRIRLDALPPRPERLVVAYLSTVGWNSDTMIRSLARTAELAGAHIWCVTNANGQTERFNDLKGFKTRPSALTWRFAGPAERAQAALYYSLSSCSSTA